MNRHPRVQAICSGGRSVDNETRRALLLLSLTAGVMGCGHHDSADPAPPARTYLDKDALLDPQTCGSCHPVHLQQWSGSMHAYASDDPVFLAMNARAQRESGGAVGSFCVNCHAPMALREGATKDGTNLATVPAKLHGITCYFCHSIDSIQDTHNNPLRVSTDAAMRANIADPSDLSPHRSASSPLYDRNNLQSSALCGSCHDIETPMGADVAQTYVEWQGSLFAHDVKGQRLTCGNCHMPASAGVAAAVPGAPTREIHDHSMPGVDTALTDFPGRDNQKAQVQSNLDPSIVAKLCVNPLHGGPNVDVTLDNAFVGHGFPSGASYDRRVWLELVAYENGAPVFQSGVVADGQSVLAIDDPSLWLFRTRILDANGMETPFQWQASSATHVFLPPALTNDPQDPAYYHAVTHSYLVPASADRITVRLRVSPIDPAILDELVASGDLDPAVQAQMPTLTLAGSSLEWTSALGFSCVP